MVRTDGRAPAAAPFRLAAKFKTQTQRIQRTSKREHGGTEIKKERNGCLDSLVEG
jgi:hypothetical protein